MRERNPTVGPPADRTNLSGPAVDRQREPERRAGAGRALGRDRPAVGLDEAAGDRQPQPGPARIGRLREPVEDVGQEGRVDPGAGVGDRDLDAPRLAAALDRAADGDRPAGRRVADRVRDEVRRRPRESGPGRPRGSAGRPAPRSSARRPRSSRPPRTTPTASVTRTSRSVGSRWRASRPASVWVSVRRSSTSRVRTRVSSRIDSRCSRSGSWTPSRIASTLPWTTASGVRSSWLTSASRRPPLGLARLEPAGHRVEAADEVADGSRRPDRDGDPHGVVALLDLLGGDEQLVERRRARPDPVTGAGERDRGEDQHDQSEQPGDVAHGPGRRDHAEDRGDHPDEDDEEHEAEQAAEPAHERPAAAAPARTAALRRPGLARRPPRRRVLRQLAARPAAGPAPALPVLAGARVAAGRRHARSSAKR